MHHDDERPTRSVWKWFWAWQDEQEEAWLRDMAHQGWHLRTVGVPGCYGFERGAPRDVVYRLDFKLGKGDWEAYRQLFADCGWDYVGRLGGWIYFRKEAVYGQPDEIFTDAATKARKYESVMFVLALALMWFSIFFGIPKQIGGTFATVLAVVQGTLALVVVYALVNLLMRVRTLRRRL
ncbi:MAG: DUF2812 domain-containing protein [bacterium]|nr:DUF2812 domain-containing protein [bacterium]